MKEVLLSEPQEYIITSTKKINLFLAGVGSGKTHLDAIIAYNFVCNFPDMKGFIGANTHQQISTSTLARIYEVWRDFFGLEQGVDYVVGVIPPKHFETIHTFDTDAYKHMISFYNGAVIFKGSLENPKVHDGKEFAWSILDETKDTKESAVKEVIIARMRQIGMYVCNGELFGKDELEKRIKAKRIKRVVLDKDEQYLEIKTGLLVRPFNPMYISTSPAKVEWINKWFKFKDFEEEINNAIFSEETFFKKEFGDKCVTISSTYHNRKNLPPGYIQMILNENSDIEGKRLVFANPFSKGGGEFYSGFNRTVHVKRCTLNNDYPLHITFDKNVVPYHPMVIWQIIKRKDESHVLRALDEICLKNPNNTTEKLCQVFERKYGLDLGEGLFYYGDATAKARTTESKEKYYDIIRRVLRPYLSNGSNRVERSNPGIISRKNFINKLFEGKIDGWSIEIDPQCKNLIGDYEYIKEDINGKKEKKVVRDPSTGESYQERGHTSDASDYLIIKVLKNLYTRYIKANG